MPDENVSTVMLHPVVENDVLMCAHGGIVQLKSIKGKPFKSGDISLILESDLQNAVITGCPNSVLGVPAPCTMVVNIPTAALSIKKLNNERAVIQDYVSMILTDKGVPLQCSPKPNKWKLACSVPVSTSSSTAGSNTDIKDYNHIFHIRYCLSKINNDIINTAYEIKVYNSSVENTNAKSSLYNFRETDFENPYKIDMGKVEESDNGIYGELLDYLKSTYSEDVYSYKALSLDIGANIFEYIFLVPKKKKYESNFGYLSTGERFLRVYKNDDNTLQKTVVTELYKVSKMYEEINLVIS